jgi:hypothetical protein
LSLLSPFCRSVRPPRALHPRLDAQDHTFRRLAATSDTRLCVRDGAIDQDGQPCLDPYAARWPTAAGRRLTLPNWPARVGLSLSPDRRRLRALGQSSAISATPRPPPADGCSDQDAPASPHQPPAGPASPAPPGGTIPSVSVTNIDGQNSVPSGGRERPRHRPGFHRHRRQRDCIEQTPPRCWRRRPASSAALPPGVSEQRLQATPDGPSLRADVDASSRPLAGSPAHGETALISGQ